MENYNIPIDDVHKFARVIYEFSKSRYYAIYILKEFLKFESMKFEKVLGDEIKQLNYNKRTLKSTMKFEESKLEKMNFGLDKLKRLRDTFIEIAALLPNYENRHPIIFL